MQHRCAASLIEAVRPEVDSARPTQTPVPGALAAAVLDGGRRSRVLSLPAPVGRSQSPAG